MMSEDGLTSACFSNLVGSVATSQLDLGIIAGCGSVERGDCAILHISFFHSA